MLIYWLRVAVKLGKILPSEIEFYLERKNQEKIKIEIDKNGSMSHWPNGFCDEEEKALIMLSCPVENWHKYVGIEVYTAKIFDY